VRSGHQFSEKLACVGGGLGGEFAGRKSTDFSQFLANFRNIGGFGEDFAIFVAQMGILAVKKRWGEVGGVRFDQKPIFLDILGIFEGFFGIFSGQSATKREKDVFLGEWGEGIGGPRVGVEEESGGMGRHPQQYFEHSGPGVSAVEAGGQGKLYRQVELGAEDGFAFGIEIVSHASVETDFADAGGAGGELFAEMRQPSGATALNEPGMDTKRAKNLGVGAGEVGDGGPVGFAGGVDMEVRNSRGAGAGEDLRQMGRKTRVLQMIVGIEPDDIFTVQRDGGCYAHS